MAGHRLPALLVALVTSATLAGGCGDDGPAAGPDTSGPDLTAPARTAPDLELFVTEDRVRVEPTGIVGEDGSVLVAFESVETACIGGQGADPADEQAVAEAVVSCVAFDRLRPVVRTQLVDQPVLEGVDPSCLDIEVDLLTSQPEELAAVLRGDENGRPAVAGAMAANCAP